MVVTENGANLDYMDTDGEITPQHYAFLICSVGGTVRHERPQHISQCESASRFTPRP
jgi:hypothetical protein